MLKITIDSEDIVAARNALQVIMGEARRIYGNCVDARGLAIIEQVKRIDKLLPEEKK